MGSKNKKRAGVITGVAGLLLLTALLFPAAAVLPGSPSKFESGNDPTLGLGNQVVNTAGNSDWITVADGGLPYIHLEDGDATNADDSFTPGQKQDTTCPDVEGHKNPPKDDFTDVASYVETNQTTGDVYFYGATVRHSANGNASENIELKASETGVCTNSPQLSQRAAGDKLIAIDYLGGGSAVQFHVLTWVTSGACNVGSHAAPCWGANVLTLDPTVAEGGVNNALITTANNPISDEPLVAGKFAEFGVNLTDAGIIPGGQCEGIGQIVWESRSSESSFVSSTKDITVENVNINNCGTAEVNKTNDDGTSPAGAVFTLYSGADTTGTVVGTCTVDANGDCNPTFTDLQPGTYTIDETTVPAGFVKDADLPFTFVIDAGENEVLNFENVKLEGSIVINKLSTKGDGTSAVANAGAEFSVEEPDPDTTSFTVEDNGALDEDPAIGSVCVSELDLGDYTVNETAAPDGYGGAPLSEADQVVTVLDNTDCGDNLPAAGATATFHNPPLSDIQVNFADGGSGETSATISCDNTTGDSTFVPPTGWDTSETVEGIDAPTTVTCVIEIDP